MKTSLSAQSSMPEKKHFTQKIVSTYQKFNLLSEIKEGEHIVLMMGKIVVRIIGLIFMLILSPFLFIGLGIAFLLAG